MEILSTASIKLGRNIGLVETEVNLRIVNGADRREVLLEDAGVCRTTMPFTVFLRRGILTKDPLTILVFVK